MSKNLPVVVKPKLRIITMVWGENYLANFLSMALPSLLAPGNLPAVIQDMDCEVVIVTEESLFGAIEENETYRRIFSYCPARLVMCDDLVVSRRMYGHSLTHALHRGFEDLGDNMTEYYLAFFNADFIIADGSYRSMIKKIKEGETLIFSPSYCTNTEHVAPYIQGRINPATNALSIPPREMAELILRYRHNTIRAKTINQQFFHMNVSDQFYWYVDSTTLLGHQLPMALVCMKPENVYLDPVCFWDYSTVSMASPTANRCVLGDSDDFLMMELRGENTFLELMRVGHVSKEEIAETLGGYMTADQFEMGHYPLTLHSSELPDDLEKSRNNLREYKDHIYALLPEFPVSYFDHPYWVGLYDQFRANQLQWRMQREEQKSATQESIEGNLSTNKKTVRNGKKKSSIFDKLYSNMFGSLPGVTMMHPRWADFRHVNAILERELPEGQESNKYVLLVESDCEERVAYRYVQNSSAELQTMSAYQLLHGDNVNFPRKFEFCFMDLSWSDMNNFVAMYERLVMRMSPGSRIVAFHAGDALRELTDKAVGQIVSLVPSNGIAKVYFSGSPAVADAVDGFKSGLQKLSGKSAGRSLGVAALMSKLASRSFRANRAAAEMPAYEVPECCTSITLEVEVR